MNKRRCENKCEHFGNPYILYQDGPISPLGVITLKCGKCGRLDFIFPGDDVDPDTLLPKEGKDATE